MWRAAVLALFVVIQPLALRASEAPISAVASSALTLVVNPIDSDACSLWFFAPVVSSIGCLTTGSAIQINTEVTAPPSTFIIDQNGRILFANAKQHRIEWIAPNDRDWGALDLEDQPISLALGPLGEIWFATVEKIGSIDSSDHLSYVPILLTSPPVAIASKLGGPYLWIIEKNPRTIGRLDAERHLKEFSINNCSTSTPGYNHWLEPPSAISDGNQLWIVRQCGDSNSPTVILKISNDGTESDYPLHGLGSRRVGLALHSETLWFTEFEPSRIGRLEPSGHITEFPTPSAHAGPTAIVLDDKGTLWFIESRLNKLVQLSSEKLGRHQK